MKATLRSLHRLTGTSQHVAFTDLCQWRTRYYCAFRSARSHNILPKGRLIIMERHRTDAYDDWAATADFTHPCGDLRDPKFLVTEDVLYLMCGCYLPNPAHRPSLDTLLPAPQDNLLQTYLAYTTDGETWSDLQPILRPNYWGWSGVYNGLIWTIASYHTGALNDASSIALWRGKTPLTLGLIGNIYEGGSYERSPGQGYRYPSSTPFEPVLWADLELNTYGCAVRTHMFLHLGFCCAPYTAADWRWHNTQQRIHPSAVLQTPQGLLVAGRALTINRCNPSETYETTTVLYALEGRTLEPLLTLPSGGDTGYCGLALGPEDGTILVSYYSQHDVPEGLPGAAVYVATVEIEAAA